MLYFTTTISLLALFCAKHNPSSKADTADPHRHHQDCFHPSKFDDMTHPMTKRKKFGMRTTIASKIVSINYYYHITTILILFFFFVGEIFDVVGVYIGQQNKGKKNMVHLKWNQSMLMQYYIDDKWTTNLI